MFERDRPYTRYEIARVIGGGSEQAYFATKNGRILAGFFRTDLNPDAPNRIFVGSGKVIRSTAHLAASTRQTFPAFLKFGTNDFRYIGNYRAITIDESAETIAQANRLSGRDEVSAVLSLQPVA